MGKVYLRGLGGKEMVGMKGESVVGENNVVKDLKIMVK